MDIYKYHIPVHKPSPNELNQKNSEETASGTKDGLAVKPSGTLKVKSIRYFYVSVIKHSKLQSEHEGSVVIWISAKRRGRNLFPSKHEETPFQIHGSVSII